MKYAFDILTQVQFNHSYFSDNVFNGLDVQVTDQTKRVLNNLGLLYKPYNGGFYILYDKNFCSSPRTREEVLKDNLLFEFTLTLKDPVFYNYTANLPAQIDKSIYHFHNSLNVTPGVPNPLHKAQFVTAQDVVALSDSRKHFFVKPFAKLDLVTHPELQLNYYIGFEARETYWRYILMSEHLQQLNSPAIIDDTDSNLFGNRLEIDLPDAKKVFGFISGSKLTLSQRSSTRLRLVENYTTASTKHKDIISFLPLPDVQYISRIPINSADASIDTNPINYSDIFIY